MVLMAAIASVLVMATLGVSSSSNTWVQDAYGQFQSGGVDMDGTWYVGEGLKHGDYFSYSMCHIDYKECAKFRLDMWVKGDIKAGTETKWLVETVVYDGNRIAVGNMELGKIVPEPTGGSEEIGKDYRGPFKSSIVWLSAFATASDKDGGEGPKAFRDTSWGKIGNIGGEQVKPHAIENIRAAGTTWETVNVGWRTGGYTSSIWVVDEFPFPIKAKTFTHVSEGIPPTEYEFVLLDYKENVKENPFEGIVPTSKIIAASGCETEFDKETSIKKSTVGAMYQVHVFYGPEDPKHGCNMEWLIKFISKYDETEFLSQVQFDILTVDKDMKPTRSLAKEEGRPFLYAPSGQYTAEIPIDEKPGLVNYVIWIYGIAQENMVPTDRHDYMEVPITIHANDTVLTSVEPPANPAVTPPTGQPTPSEAAPIPTWIKNNAGWWADGLIDDGSFIQGIQYLINDGIIQIPPTSKDRDAAGDMQDADAVQEIPPWIKNNAGWWAEGSIDDNTFVLAIQYLIKNGVMTVSQPSQ